MFSLRERWYQYKLLIFTLCKNRMLAESKVKIKNEFRIMFYQTDYNEGMFNVLY